MVIEKGKPDLLTVLLRRKTTVATFLDQSGIIDLAGLQTFVKSLEATWSLSNEFMREANAHILKKYSLEVSKKSEAVEDSKEMLEEKPKSSPGRKKTKKASTEDTEDEGN